MSQRTTKPTIRPVWPAKTQISLYTHPVWQGFLFIPLWIHKGCWRHMQSAKTLVRLPRWAGWSEPSLVAQVLLSPRFLEKASGILLLLPSVCLSVCPLCYLLPNRWTESNQIWWVACLYKWGVQEHVYFWPRPHGPWGGVRRSNINNFLFQSQF